MSDFCSQGRHGSRVGRVEMSSLRVADALVGAVTAPRGRDSGVRALQIKAPSHRRCVRIKE